MRSIHVFALMVVFLMCINSVVLALDLSKQPKLRVKVNITASDNIADLVNSYIKRELRNLNDIQVVDKDPMFLINLLVLEHRSSSGNVLEYITSAVAMLGFNNTFMAFFSLEKKEKKLLLDLTSDLYYFPCLFKVLAVPPTDLKGLCKDIVASFDTQCAEPRRMVWQELQQTKK